MPMDPDSPFADEHPRLRPEDETPEIVAAEDATAGDYEAAADDAVRSEIENSEAEMHSASGDVDTSIPGASDPLDQTLTECHCKKCNTKAKWTGPLTADMIERTFTRGVDEMTGLPNCVHCGSAMVAINFLAVEDAISQVAEQLDAERAGDAARPMHQPSLPGVRPMFDWRTAQLRTEALEAECERTEEAWDAAKKEATEAKKEYDESVEALRKHIQETHRARVDAEYQHRGDSPIAPVPDAAAAPPLAGCLTERTTGKPCPICRNLNVAPADNGTAAHLAAAILTQALEETLDAETMAEALEEITGVIVPVEQFEPWTKDDYKAVARYLEAYAARLAQTGTLDEMPERPAILGRPHETGDIGGGCRICGAKMQVLAELEGHPNGFPVGTFVGIDCPGEPAADVEPARQAKPRHAKPADRQKAKQAKGTKDHAAAQRAEGAKKSTEKKKPVKATLKSGAKKRTTR